MSKKIMALVLTLSMLLCFTACGNKADSNETDTSQNGAVGSSEGIQSSESELEPKPETEPDPKTTPEYHFKESGWLLECFDTEEAKAVERGIV